MVWQTRVDFKIVLVSPIQDEKPKIDPEQWLDRYGDDLYRFAYYKIGNRDRAEELVQECLLAACKSKDRYAGQASEKTWLMSILKHKIIDVYRKKHKERPVSEVSREESDEEFFDEKGHWKKPPTIWGGDPKQALENREFWAIFSKCVEDLPERMEAVYRMRELDELETAVVEKDLKLSSSNIWVILHRARLKLRQCLEKHWFQNKGAPGT